LIKFIILIISSIYLYSENNSLDISIYKYGELLYNEPRGIGCHKCHGKFGGGRIITSYLDKKGKKIYIKAPRINNIELSKFRFTLEKGSQKSLIMPIYHLTEDEIESIYHYINKQGY